MKKITSFVVASIVVLSGCAKNDQAENSKTEPVGKQDIEMARTDVVEDNTLESDTVSNEISEEVSEYKDGIYTADGSYDADDGDVHEDIDFRFGVREGKVTSLELVGEPGHPISKHHQEDFMEEMPGQVVGKDLKGLTVEAVSGASDTTTGFRKALEDVKRQAILTQEG